MVSLDVFCSPPKECLSLLFSLFKTWVGTSLCPPSQCQKLMLDVIGNKMVRYKCLLAITSAAAQCCGHMCCAALSRTTDHYVLASC